MFNSINILFSIILIFALFFLLRFYLQLREKNYKLEILEIKLKAIQKKINEEKSQSAEIVKRLEEQKGPLEKKWEEIQENERLIENKAFQLQQDREELEKSKQDLEKIKTKIDENRSKLEALDQHLKQKWSHERQQFEIKKMELITIINQINAEKNKLFAQQSLIEKEKQSIVAERMKLSKRAKEFEIQHAYFENMRKETLAEKLEMQKAEQNIVVEKNRLAAEREVCQTAKRTIEQELEYLRTKGNELQLKENILEQLEEELFQRNHQHDLLKNELKSVLRRNLINMLFQIKQTREKTCLITHDDDGLKIAKKRDDYQEIKEPNADLCQCMVKGCNFQAPDKNAINRHFKEAHLGCFVKELSYQEVRSKHNGELPVEIYQCHYCKGYFFADPKSNNPVATIINHVEQCEKSNGYSLVSFRIVNNLHEIRNSVIHNLPIISKCLLCGQYFKNSKEDELLDHYLKFHSHDFISEPSDVSRS